MSNAITEGKDRELPPDRDGEILRAPTPAAIELKTEIAEASAYKEEGKSQSMRDRSSIESRTDLRLAAINEAMRADPARSSATLMLEQDTARRWADLDASEFGLIRSDSRRENALEAIAGHVRVSPQYAEELKNRSLALADAAKAVNEALVKLEHQRESMGVKIMEYDDNKNKVNAFLNEKTGLVNVSVTDQIGVSSKFTFNPFVVVEGGHVERYDTRYDRLNVPLVKIWLGGGSDRTGIEVSGLSESVFKTIVSNAISFSRRQDKSNEKESNTNANNEGKDVVGEPAERGEAFRKTLAKEAAGVPRETEVRGERDASERVAEEQRSANISAAAQSRAALMDAAAVAAVASVRARETARVVDQLASLPDTATQQLRDAQQVLKAPPLDGRVTVPDDPDIAAAQHARAIKRPVSKVELSQSLLTRFIVSLEKRGLYDKVTQFTFRSGEQQGRVAFVDAGKALSTELDDKSTIRAMVEVASAKNWKEITVSGTDEFRRNAWLEASLNGMQVRGYEPREADKQILAELQVRKPTNTITAAERERKDSREPATLVATQRKHIDGDSLTLHEATVLGNSRAILDAKALGEQFTEATLRELEAKLRGERVYVGEIVDHGKAPYKFDRDNDDSYYVTLKTAAGEQVIWGKGLAEAMQDRRAGEQIVLQNIGKRDVTVKERIRNAQGDVVDVRPKGSQLNAWKAELLSRFSEKARADFANRSSARQPTLGVYDVKAPRAPVQPAAPARTPGQQRNAEQQHSARER